MIVDLRVYFDVISFTRKYAQSLLYGECMAIHTAIVTLYDLIRYSHRDFYRRQWSSVKHMVDSLTSGDKPPTDNNNIII